MDRAIQIMAYNVSRSREDEDDSVKRFFQQTLCNAVLLDNDESIRACASFREDGT